MDGKEYARLIEMRLAEIGMKKSEFYSLTGVSRSSFSQWKANIHDPSAEAVIKINNVIGTNFPIPSNLSDSIFDRIQMLQDLRDSERALLQVTKNMTDDEIRRTVEFIKSLKGDV